MKESKKMLNLNKLVISKLTNPNTIIGGSDNCGSFVILKCKRPSCPNGQCPSNDDQFTTNIDC